MAMTGPGRHGLPGPRQLADPGQVLARTCRGPSSTWSAAPRRPGLITGPTQDSGKPMHGHGFALMFLASRLRDDHQGVAPPARSATAIRKAVTLTSQGQSAAGGWTYIPGAGDEGSVTVTQVQALRAAHNAGFLVPRAVIEEAGEVPREVPDPRGGHPVLAPLRRRAAAADLGGRRRHPLQRRPVRQPDRHRLPEVRLGPVPRQRRVRTRGAATPSTPTSTPRRASTWPATSTGTTTSPRPATS